MHASYMKQALELAKLGIGKVNPNPLVGAVVVKEGNIIASGYHAYYGHDHAEIQAFKQAKADLQGATLYVTLEPCSHYGKTPPCCLAIIEKGIKEVYIASQDPNPLVSGRGIEMLNQHGIVTHVGLLDEENRQLNKFFFTSMMQQRPYVTIKTAMSLDGKIATKTKEAKWITSEASRQMGHQLRNQHSAILVGINTVLADDPLLTTRIHGQLFRNPVRVVVDSFGKIPIDSSIVKTAMTVKTYVACIQMDKSKKAQLEARKVNILEMKEANQRVDLVSLMTTLHQLGIDSVLIEGGQTLNAEAMKAGIVDEIVAFIAPMLITGQSALSAFGGEGIASLNEAHRLTLVDMLTVGEDIMLRYTVQKGDN